MIRTTFFYPQIGEKLNPLPDVNASLPLTQVPIQFIVQQMDGKTVASITNRHLEILLQTIDLQAKY